MNQSNVKFYLSNAMIPVSVKQMNIAVAFICIMDFVVPKNDECIVILDRLFVIKFNEKIATLLLD